MYNQQERSGSCVIVDFLGLVGFQISFSFVALAFVLPVVAGFS
jgi:hypothetical protein